MAESDFIAKWYEYSQKKKTLLCAGLDPAPYALGRGEKGLGKKTDKRKWAFRYLEAVAPYCAAVKPNIQYWKSGSDMETLREIGDMARELDVVVIEDAKLADIGATNESGMYYAAERADAVTVAPYAGNISEAAEQGKKRGIAVIIMCLMSNPEYEAEKRKLVPIPETAGEHTQRPGRTHEPGGGYVEQYLHLAREAVRRKTEGVVIGAPSPKNHITEEEIAKVRDILQSGLKRELLVLCPGVGAQGGEASTLLSVFGRQKVIINVGRSLMFPNGSDSTPEDQAAAARKYRDLFTR